MEASLQLYPKMRELFIFAAKPVSTRHGCGICVGFGLNTLDTLTSAQIKD